MNFKTLFLFFAMPFVFVNGCITNTGAQEHIGYLHKDLSEQMDAVSIAQGAIGDAIRKNDFDGAEWAYDKLDSIFQLMQGDIDNHKNLLKPFSFYYDKKLKSPMNSIKLGIQNKDTIAAYSAYKLLVDRCNSCHNEHGVKERAHEF